MEMDIKKMTIEEAAHVLMCAEKIKADPTLFKAAKESLNKNVGKINSIQDLKNMREKGLTKKDLMTEEDKAALQSKIETDDHLEEMGIKVKDKVNMVEDDEEIMEGEDD